MKALAVSILAIVAIAGCAKKHQPGPTTMRADEGQTAFASASEVRRGNVAKGRQSDAPMRLKLDVHLLTVPLGTISRNEEVWKRVNEQAVDVATYDLLIKNGVRVGEAPIAEYERFRQLIAEHPAQSQLAQLVTAEAKDVDLEIRKEVPSQTIWYLNGWSELIGRTFDRCENFLTLSYQPAPRKRGYVRIVLCPVVKETRKRLEWSTGGKELEVAFTQPQRFYDVNLRADVPVDSFLIIAPSAEATWPGSIGNRFFVEDGPAEQMENVLLLVPRHVPSVME
ncbi:MAG: hypothetical protein WBD40_11700 [Tepidisphaeraceae bacterium]